MFNFWRKIKKIKGLHEDREIKGIPEWVVAKINVIPMLPPDSIHNFSDKDYLYKIKIDPPDFQGGKYYYTYYRKKNDHEVLTKKALKEEG